MKMSKVKLLVSRYAEGVSIETLAKDYRIKDYRVREVLRQQSIDLRPAVVTKPTVTTRSRTPQRTDLYTTETSNKIVRQYREGHSIHSLARQHSCSDATIRRILVMNGVQVCTRATRKIEEIKHLYCEEQKSLTRTGNELDFSHNTVSKYLKRDSVPMRFLPGTRYCPDLDPMIRHHYEAGKTMGWISSKLKISAHTVKLHLRRMGIMR